jgi:hypothetical protein
LGITIGLLTSLSSFYSNLDDAILIRFLIDLCLTPYENPLELIEFFIPDFTDIRVLFKSITILDSWTIVSFSPNLRDLVDAWLLSYTEIIESFMEARISLISEIGSFGRPE